VVGSDFEYVRHCAGTHVHVEQQPGVAVDQHNAFVALDPALALVNSSPYFRGQRLAAGARSKLYRWMAYDDLPHQGRLWPYVDDREEYTRRLERRYEDFEAAAMDAGIDRRAVAKHFDPESAVWTPVQFREAFSTVEWRSPDAALPSDVVRLADRLAALVARLDEVEVRIEGDRGRVGPDEVVLPEFDAVMATSTTRSATDSTRRRCGRTSTGWGSTGRPTTRWPTRSTAGRRSRPRRPGTSDWSTPTGSRPTFAGSARSPGTERATATTARTG
jgi:hypothetical protein